MKTTEFYFENKKQVEDYCNEQIAVLNSMKCEDALNDGCDNENANQNALFSIFMQKVERMESTLGLFEFRSSKVLDGEKMKQVWNDAVSQTSKCDDWLKSYESLIVYFTNIKKMLSDNN